MRKAKQSTAKNVMVLMVDSTNHVTGKTGLTLTITASKNGAAFGSISPTVTERGDGWYSLALTASHTDTLGDLALHITGTAADPADMVLLVEAGATDADVSTRSTYAGGAVASVTAAVTVGALNSNVITAASVNTAALDGKGNWNVGKTGYSLTQAFPANFSSLSITAGGLVDLVQSAADKVWATATRLLTAGTNIVLAKGVGLTGLNDIDASVVPTTEQIREEIESPGNYMVYISDQVTEARMLLRNKRVLDPVTGIETIYDDNGIILFTRNVWQDAAGTIPYADAGADRVERYI